MTSFVHPSSFSGKRHVSAGHAAIEYGELIERYWRGVDVVAVAVGVSEKYKNSTYRVLGGDPKSLFDVPWKGSSIIVADVSQEVVSASSGVHYLKRGWKTTTGGIIYTCSCPGFRYTQTCRHLKA